VALNGPGRWTTTDGALHLAGRPGTSVPLAFALGSEAEAVAELARCASKRWAGPRELRDLARVLDALRAAHGLPACAVGSLGGLLGATRARTLRRDRRGGTGRRTKYATETRR
jgi:hypothetical protein